LKAGALVQQNPRQRPSGAALLPEAFAVQRDQHTRWADNDSYGRLTSVVVLALFDSAVTGWLIEASGTDIRHLDSVGVLAETSCKCMREASFPDRLSVGIGLDRVGRSSVIYRLGLFRRIGESLEPEPLALGRFVQVYVDATTRRPVPIAAPVKEALDRIG
jgi:acyl-CoA thioester hydrolase